MVILQKRSSSWSTSASKRSVLDKLRGTDTDDQILKILSIQAKTCFKAPGKSVRNAAKAVANAKSKPRSKATAKAASVTAFAGNNFTKATVLDARCLVYQNGKSVTFIVPEQLGIVPGIALVSKTVSFTTMSSNLDNAVLYHDEDMALLVSGTLKQFHEDDAYGNFGSGFLTSEVQLTLKSLPTKRNHQSRRSAYCFNWSAKKSFIIPP